VIDDPVDEATVRSDLLLEARRQWVSRTVLSRLKPNGFVVMVGTPWREGDVVDSAEQSGSYVVIRMKALSEGPLVEADVAIPSGVTWRPSLPSREVE
jgi:hypothetical protein